MRSGERTLEAAEQIVDAAFHIGEGSVDFLLAGDRSTHFFADNVLDCELALDSGGQGLAEIGNGSDRVAMRQRLEGIRGDHGLEGRQMARARPFEVIVGEKLQEFADGCDLFRRPLLGRYGPGVTIRILRLGATEELRIGIDRITALVERRASRFRLGICLLYTSPSPRD